MVRGVPIEGLREQLFAAAERVLVRDGPQAVSSRAITTEAGCAKGLLHNHFGDLESFLTEFVADRLELAKAQASNLLERVGKADIAANLTQTLAAMFGSHALAVITLVGSRPRIAERLHESARASAMATLADLEHLIAHYLETEKRAGRLPSTADSQAIALALVSTAHHLFVTHATADPKRRLRRVADALIAPAGGSAR